MVLYNVLYIGTMNNVHCQLGWKISNWDEKFIFS